jgi:hypothetical protein
MLPFYRLIFRNIVNVIRWFLTANACYELMMSHISILSHLIHTPTGTWLVMEDPNASTL